MVRFKAINQRQSGNASKMPNLMNEQMNHNLLMRVMFRMTAGNDEAWTAACFQAWVRRVRETIQYNHIRIEFEEQLFQLEKERFNLVKRCEQLEMELGHKNKELERLAAATIPTSAPVAGSGLAAARSGERSGAENRIAELEAALADAELDANILASGANFRTWLADRGYTKEDKFEMRKLVLGQSSDAAGGIEGLIGLDEDELNEMARHGLDGMRKEFEQQGDEKDKANFRYIVDGIALEDDWMPEHVKKSIKDQKYHGGHLAPGDFDMNHKGFRLNDFVDHADAKLAKLKEHHVAALRLYTTNSFRKFNEPLRNLTHPHPFALTVYYLAQGLKKLRKVQAQLDPEGFATKSFFWRGLSNTTMDMEEFKRVGGTELAPMSTSADYGVAIKYAASKRPLVLRYNTKGLTKGVSIKFLSVYPKEEEYLYPPGTMITFESMEEMDGYKVVTVLPVMA
eukprot:gnl/TRDRNA2_/TRDRNA2_57751_c0_seq1.p1 gnl/TRDRNA2_/TRDRNA2_57751_c0~~gnl/TRDRNA2_/TRDRNA2_57751_c0_seq1.p1  ORF type:complete len:455 (-),score=84.90 gnl/TRDRNA2_/TRDRNA2_57751_c0_seq1:43-1407(-)